MSKTSRDPDPDDWPFEKIKLFNSDLVRAYQKTFAQVLNIEKETIAEGSTLNTLQVIASLVQVFSIVIDVLSSYRSLETPRDREEFYALAKVDHLEICMVFRKVYGHYLKEDPEPAPTETPDPHDDILERIFQYFQQKFKEAATDKTEDKTSHTEHPHKER